MYAKARRVLTKCGANIVEDKTFLRLARKNRALTSGAEKTLVKLRKIWYHNRVANVTEERQMVDANTRKWDLRFMEIAKTVANWSSCFQQNRHVGAVITKDKRIMTTGYNGACSGVVSCAEKGECLRRKLNIPSGTRHELCYAVHAEQNAIVQAAKLGISLDGGTLYCTHQPCVICAKMIINAGIKRVVYSEGYPDEFALQLFTEAGVSIEQLEA